MATFAQIGNFEVKNVNGKLDKNGGNVVSYFCTPEGRVIHFVLGPAKPDKLLAEATWAVAAYQEAKNSSDGNRLALASGLQKAHRQRLESRDRNKKVHQFLVKNPYPWIRQIYVKVFDDLLNEEISKAGPYVNMARRSFDRAKDMNRPVVFFLFRKPGKTAARQYAKFMQQPQVLSVLPRCVVIPMPLEELPALSQALDIPSYELPGKSTPAIIMAHADGRQIDAVAGLKNQSLVGGRLWRAVELAKKESKSQSRRPD